MKKLYKLIEDYKAITNWKEMLQNKLFLWSMLVVLILFAVQMTFFSHFQGIIEMREGFVLYDPILNLFSAVKIDTITFIAIYSAHLLALILAFRKPQVFFQLIIGYLLVYFFRIFTIYLMPLNPPVGTISLEDPVLFWFNQNQHISKDLFYSGHTSSTFMAFLTTTNKKAKTYIFIALIFVVSGVIFQKVHYTIDVYVAFFFAYTAYRIARWIRKRLGFIDKQV